MTKNEYIAEVRRILAVHIEPAAVQLNEIFLLLPAQAKRITLEIFVDQGGEGFLDIRAGLEGPDLYALNQAIATHADLFTTIMAEDGLSPDLPLMDGDNEDFSVQDVLTDCGVTWLSSVWTNVHHSACPIPVEVISSEGYGTLLPYSLHP